MAATSPSPRTLYQHKANARGFKLGVGRPPAVPGAHYDVRARQWYLGDLLLTKAVKARLRKERQVQAKKLKRNLSKQAMLTPTPSPPRSLAAVNATPPGCRIYRGALQQDIIHRALPELAQRAQESGGTIRAGQSDGLRKQARVKKEEKIAKALLQSLRAAGELDGRTASELNTIFSAPRCSQQERHWDFDPDACQRARRKPCSVIAALEDGARLVVYDELKGKDERVVLQPGDVLVFDGDVAHAGAAYRKRNVRLHVYLDVSDVKRGRDVTWFSR